MALQTSNAVHLGVDNLGVVRHDGRLLDGCRGPIRFEQVNDGDLLLFIERVLHHRGLDTVRIMRTWFFMVGFVGKISWAMMLLMKLLILAAEEYAVIGAGRNLSGVCGRWCLVILNLHRLFIAISRTVV